MRSLVAPVTNVQLRFPNVSISERLYAAFSKEQAKDLELQLLYFIHDIDDAAIARRFEMLQLCKCEVSVLGFDRKRSTAQSRQIRFTKIGETADARFAQRVISIIKSIPDLWNSCEAMRSAQVILCRNLEMLIIGIIGRMMSRGRASIIYECLDIHRLMTRTDMIGWVLRAAERFALRSCNAIVVSSPAFFEDHFASTQGFSGAVLVIENKVIKEYEAAVPLRTAARPLRIGWFGIIRCRKSFEFLKLLLSQYPGQFEVIMAGKPFRDVFENLEAEVNACEGMKWRGPYRHAEVSKLYAEVDLCWAIDFFEEGFNSSWLLPNRLYESLAHGVAPIALLDTETGRWLTGARVGLVLEDLSHLGELLVALNDAKLNSLALAARLLDRSRVVTGRSELRNLERKLRVLEGDI